MITPCTHIVCHEEWLSRLSKLRKKGPTKRWHLLFIVESNLDIESPTLLVSQWSACLAPVSGYLKEHDIIHVKYASQCLIAQNKAKWTMFNRYQGDMKRVERNIAVRDFTTEVDVRITIWLPYRRRSNQRGILYPGDRFRSTDVVHWCWY